MDIAENYSLGFAYYKYKTLIRTCNCKGFKILKIMGRIDNF